jgi:hypothetical protein
VLGIAAEAPDVAVTAWARVAADISSAAWAACNGNPTIS